MLPSHTKLKMFSFTRHDWHDRCLRWHQSATFGLAPKRPPTITARTYVSSCYRRRLIKEHAYTTGAIMADGRFAWWPHVCVSHNKCKLCRDWPIDYTSANQRTANSSSCIQCTDVENKVARSSGRQMMSQSTPEIIVLLYVCRAAGITLPFVSIYTGRSLFLDVCQPPPILKKLLGSGRITEMTKLSSRTAEIRVSAEISHAWCRCCYLWYKYRCKVLTAMGIICPLDAETTKMMSLQYN